tara:strand:- start:2961 stop:3194 length:234 start_codon:yes stop_codon:yes gene_type:complete
MNKTIKDAIKSGHISKKQGENLPEKMVMGLIKANKRARTGDAKNKKKGGVVEKVVKVGKAKGKRGRPKAGSMVKVVK